MEPKAPLNGFNGNWRPSPLVGKNLTSFSGVQITSIVSFREIFVPCFTLLQLPLRRELPICFDCMAGLCEWLISCEAESPETLSTRCEILGS